MPTVSRFRGIEIEMYYNDHPPPHFHAYYGEYEAEVGIDPIQIIEGDLPRRVWKLVRKWAAKHQAALMDNWQLMRRHHPPQKLPP